MSFSTSSRSDFSTGVYGIAFVLLSSFADSSAAAGGGSILNDLIRGAARVADDVPLNQSDMLLKRLSKSKPVRDVVEAELKRAGKLTTGTDEVVKLAARSRNVTQLLRQATTHLDPNLLRRLDTLDDATKETALVLAKGGDEIGMVLPDVASRGRFLQGGGAETVATVGLYGKDAARAALRMDEALRAGTLIVRPAQRAVTLADFGKVMTGSGDASWSFWKRYVEPHWKVWLGTGALAAYLANPEVFQDAAGNLTEAGFQHLTELVGEVSAAAIRGVGRGSERAGAKTRDAVIETFSGSNFTFRLLGTVIFLSAASMLFRRIRYHVLRPLRWLNRSPAASEPRQAP